jgi:hypothetical protein
MQIATKHFIVCVLAATFATLSSRGADTDAQVRAREALRQKMSELNAQPATTNVPAPSAPSKAPELQPAPKPTPEPAATTAPTPTPAETVKTVPPAPTRIEAPPTRMAPPGQAQAPAPVVKTTRQPKPKPAPVAKTTNNAPAPSGQVTASRPDSEKVAKARQAMEEKMRELDAQGGQPAVVSQPTVSQPAGETQPVSRPAVASQPTPASNGYRTPEITTTQPRVSAETSAGNEPLPTPPPVNKVKRSAQAQPSTPQRPNRPTETKPGPAPRQVYALPAGPPPPVSSDKVQKLNTLLQQYQADRITPEQYQQERAKILAGP